MERKPSVGMKTLSLLSKNIPYLKERSVKEPACFVRLSDAPVKTVRSSCVKIKEGDR